eukprot:TRINITY_DN4007_c0_g1_i3.p1 TRINITY_DN4007_c0_g1~~TRINITY_DN4007_c0_g1_i3.p1  ORF type:complete len:179 (+),score=34.86 TRINITY_DN4007_c0_g1_i3:456-992(+)
MQWGQKMYVPQRKVDAMVDEVMQEMSAKYTMSEEEKEKAKQKWHGGGPAEKIAEPAKEKEVLVRCPFGHKVVAQEEGGKAWICDGAEKWKPPCTHGSHDTGHHYACTSPRCLWSGCCPDHYEVLLAAAKKREKEDFMTAYITNRYASSSSVTAGTNPRPHSTPFLSPPRTRPTRLYCR